MAAGAKRDQTIDLAFSRVRERLFDARRCRGASGPCRIENYRAKIETSACVKVTRVSLATMFVVVLELNGAG
jgi:hypothetical protein